MAQILRNPGTRFNVGWPRVGGFAKKLRSLIFVRRAEVETARQLREVEVSRVVPFPVGESSHIPSETDARAMAAERLEVTRERTHLTKRQWARIMGDRLQRTFTAELMDEWERPTGSKPPMHWAIVAFSLGAPVALEVGSRLLFGDPASLA